MANKSTPETTRAFRAGALAGAGVAEILGSLGVRHLRSALALLSDRLVVTERGQAAYDDDGWERPLDRGFLTDWVRNGDGQVFGTAGTAAAPGAGGRESARPARKTGSVGLDDIRPGMAPEERARVVQAIKKASGYDFGE